MSNLRKVDHHSQVKDVRSFQLSHKIERNDHFAFDLFPTADVAYSLAPIHPHVISGRLFFQDVDVFEDVVAEDGLSDLATVIM